MQKFTDTKGRSWLVEINLAVIKRVKTLCNFNILDLLDFRGKTFEQYQSDPVFMVDTLYAVCAKQAQELGVTDIDFAEGLAGDCIEDANMALLEAIVNFTPSQKAREAQKKLLALMKKTGDEVITKALEALDKPETIAAMSKAAMMYTDSLLNSQAQSESTPAN